MASSGPVEEFSSSISVLFCESGANLDSEANAEKDYPFLISDYGSFESADSVGLTLIFKLLLVRSTSMIDADRFLIREEEQFNYRSLPWLLLLLVSILKSSGLLSLFFLLYIKLGELLFLFYKSSQYWFFSGLTEKSLF